MEMVVFLLVAAVAVVTAMMVMLHRNPVIQALFLVGNLLCIAIFYLLLGAQFLAAIQVIVYAGAIMVLILFVIMLLNLRREGIGVRAGAFQRTVASLAAAAFLLLVSRAILAIPAYPPAALPASFGSVEFIGRWLYSDYFYPFEAISLVLLVAMAGAVVLAKRRL